MLADGVRLVRLFHFRGDRYRDLVLAEGYALADNVRGVELLKRPL